MHSALVALAAVLPAPAPLNPAFLDSPTEVRVWLDSPLPPAQMKGRFAFHLNGKAIGVREVKPGGEPEHPRVLPRTPGRVILAGTLQEALGGKAWDPDGELTQMTETSPGVHELVVELAPGRYEFKVTRNGSWNENWGQGFTAGGSNIPLEVKDRKQVVAFRVDFGKQQVLNSIDHPSEVKAPPAAPKRPQRTAPTTYPVAVLTLARPIRPDELDDSLTLIDDRGSLRPVIARRVLDMPSLKDSGFLGARYNRTGTQFRVWSPVARRATLLLFSTPTGGVARRVPMTRTTTGTWEATVKGDLHGRFYQFEFESYGRVRRTQDINSFAASRDSQRSMVVDLSRTNPNPWPTAPKLRHRSQTDSVLYEISVRDFTVHEDSGVPKAWRGKYAGLGLAGTRVPGTNTKTGLDYLVDLGVTDIHLLPIQNFLTSSPDEYTWGYATNLFNVPEETYSATPNSPVGVIREFKSMVGNMHRAGLRVILDVVYNHTWPPEGDGSAFWQTIPYYYFRTNDRGDVLNESGVGNSMDDARPMVRKFIRDSLLYWLREYRVDGFRFDLIGMHEPASVRDWAKAMRAVRPDVILYGEPWTGGGPTRFGKGAQRGSGVAVFNDRFRGVFRGDLDGSNAGFAAFGGGDRNALQKALTGWIDPDGFTDSPQETINYISAHDNMTLLDRFARALPNEADQRAAVRLTGAAVLLAQGVPFLEGGAQIGRTKGGNANSYNAGDVVNGYDWSRGLAWQDVNAYYRGLIALRRSTRAFRLPTAAAVRQSVRFLPSAEGVVAMTLAGQPGDAYRSYLVVLNGTRGSASVEVPGGTWNRLVSPTRAGTAAFGFQSGSILAEPGAHVFGR